jgi:hypothetical protein
MDGKVEIIQAATVAARIGTDLTFREASYDNVVLAKGSKSVRVWVIRRLRELGMPLISMAVAAVCSLGRRRPIPVSSL